MKFRALSERPSVSSSEFHRARFGIVLGAFVLVVVHLSWEMLHGGVASHHFLARSDLPSISNWWGIILVPALAWFVAGRVQNRSASGIRNNCATFENVRRAMPAFAGALLYGGALAVSFAYGFGIEQYLFFGLFAIGLFLPIYRGEYLLGFVLGMMVTFGAILPMIVGTIVASFSWLAHALFRAAMWLFSRLRRA